MRTRPIRSTAAALLAAALIAGAFTSSAAAAPPSPATARSAPQTFIGSVTAGGASARDTTVTLFVAGDSPGAATAVATAPTDRAGRFELLVPASVSADAVLYATAAGGVAGKIPLVPDVELATALGDLRAGKITINELTTVAAGYSLAQFAADGAIGGAEPGLSNAAKMSRNLVDPVTGAVTKFFSQPPNGSDTETLATFNSLASIAAGCAARTNDCAAFLDAATDAWGARPATTWRAMTTLPTNPSGAPGAIMAQIPRRPEYKPVRTVPPAGWYLAVKFWGDGRQFNGPGNLAFDSGGRVWANTNATWARQLTGVCPGREVFRLDPYVPGQPLATYRGGGLSGSGFGISLDPQQRAWVTNFGFTSEGCQESPPPSNSVSLFDADGTALSPGAGGTSDGGFLEGPISFPQGVKSDVDGDVWIANCGDHNLVVYRDGDPTLAQIVGEDMTYTFDVAQNAEGNIFVTSNGLDKVFAFRPDGTSLDPDGFGDSTTTSKPLGIASDSIGNVWVSNSEAVDIPCRPGGVFGPPTADEEAPHGSMARVTAVGEVTRFEGAGMTVPWGIAVDGDDNIWVANFFGQRLSHLCGARIETCPTGEVGAAISPATTGYFSDALQRNTGVQVDGSGNVWLANNWKTVPSVKTGPYGDGLVAFLGMAEPIRMPLVGTPHAPVE